MAVSPSAAELERVVREAGALALSLAGRARVERKPDASLVTDADTAVERQLSAELRRLLPDSHILGEEGVSHRERRPGQPTWAIDPIDGTAVFVAGLPTWSVSVGLIRDGVPELGCVYLPVPDELFLAPAEGPLLWNGTAVDRRDERGCSSDGQFDKECWLAVPSRHHRSYRIGFPAKLRCLGSTAAHFAWAARGAAAAAVSNGRIWDLAGALACCRAAGVRYRYLSGAELDLELLLEGDRTPEPVLAAHPEDFAAIRATIEYLRPPRPLPARGRSSTASR